MDLKGQKLCESLCFYLIVLACVGGFAGGLYTQSLKNLFIIYASGVCLTALVTIPDWPFYNRHPLKWLDPVTPPPPTEGQPAGDEAEGRKKTK